MRTVFVTIAAISIVLLLGMVVGIIIARHRDKKDEIEGESFRVDCSEK